jgi:hypothetical protein
MKHDLTQTVLHAHLFPNGDTLELVHCHDGPVWNVTYRIGDTYWRPWGFWERETANLVYEICCLKACPLFHQRVSLALGAIG